MPTKRTANDSEDDEFQPSVAAAAGPSGTKKAKTASTSQAGASNDASRPYTRAVLLAKTHEQLVEICLSLQSEPKGRAVVELTPAQIKEKADAARKLMVNQIGKSMKWTASCKTGTAKWSYEAFVSNEAVFLEMFELKAFKGKQMKMKREVFQDEVGTPVGQVRYDSLSITSAEVSGSYGK